MAEKPFAVVPYNMNSITTGNQRANRLAAHLNEFSEIGMVWQSNGNADLWVQWDLGSTRSLDHFAIIAANAQAGTTYRLRLSNALAQLTTTPQFDSGALNLIDSGLTADDGLYTSFLDIAVQSRRYCRIDIAGHTGDFQASALCLGKKVEFANYYTPTSVGFEHEDNSEIDWGRTGVIEEALGIKYRRLSMTFGWMSDADRFSTFDPFVRDLGKTGVALWRFDPEANIQRQSKTYWGWLTNSPVFTASTFKMDRFESDYEILSMI